MKLLPLLLLAAALAWPQSKDELKAQLDAVRREKAALLAALAKAQGVGKAARDTAQAERSGTASEAKSAAEENAREARAAAIRAAEEAAATRAQQAEEFRAQDRSDNTLLITSATTLLTLVAGWFWLAFNKKMDRKWLLEDAARKHAEQLEFTKRVDAGITHSNNLTEKFISLREGVKQDLAEKQDTPATIEKEVAANG